MRTATAKDKDVAIPPPSRKGAKKVTMFGFRPSPAVEAYANKRTEFDPASGERAQQLTPLLNELCEFRVELEQALGETLWLELQAKALVSKRKLPELVADAIRQSLKGSKR